MSSRFEYAYMVDRLALHCQAMIQKLYHIVCIALFLALTTASQAMAQDLAAVNTPDQQHVEINILPEKWTIEPGETILVAIQQIIDKDWHTYWQNPGDSGQAPHLTWAMPDGFTTPNLHWPVPEKFVIGGLANYGYSTHTVLMQEITAPWDLPDGSLDFALDVNILVCAEICIPESSTHHFTLNDPGGETKDYGPFINTAYNHMPEELQGWPFTYHEDGDDLVLHFKTNIPSGIKTLSVANTLTFFPKQWGIVDNTAPLRVTQRHDGYKEIILRQKRGDRPLSAITELEGVITYPSSRRHGFDRGYSFTAQFDDTKIQVALPTAATVKKQPLPKTSGTSLIQALLFAVLGGLILNLMPCVFPVLSLKALKLCRLSGKEQIQARYHGLLYTAGILISFAAFAVLLIGLKTAGTQIGWGFHLQNTTFVIVLTYLLFLIGLNLSGLFEFGTRLMGAGSNLIDGDHYRSSFFTGILAALVATPCTAPFMGVALGFALTQSALIALSVFLALGFGLALPYLLLSFIPALRSLLPKPGAWMETFKKILAIPMYLSALWLGWVVWQQTNIHAAAALILGIALLIPAIILLGKDKRSLLTRMAALALIGLSLTSGFYATTLLSQKTAPTHITEQHNGSWIPYSIADFAALEAGDHPLFVNMTAAWCITCKVNERIALHDGVVQRLSKQHNVQFIKGDWTSYDAAITDFLESYGRNGVPLYVYYGPRDMKTGKRPDPVLLPQILTPDILENTIKGDL